MTIIELFDKSPIENMVSCLSMRPDKVIFVGDGKQMEKQEKIFNSFARIMGIPLEIQFRSVNRNKLDDIVKLLTEIVTAEADSPCSIDLTGGEDLMLVAVGIVRAKLKEQGVSFKLHRYNINKGNVTDYDESGKTIKVDMPKLTVEQNVALYGGAVVYDMDKAVGTHRWNFADPKLRDAVETMWEICRKNPVFWNGQLRMLHSMQKLPQVCPTFADPNHVEMDVAKAETLSPNKRLNLPGIYQELADGGLLRDFVCNEQILSFTYASDDIRRILEKEGTILELKAYLLLSDMPKEKPGKKGKRKPALSDPEPMFNSVMTGVFLDWDGVIHGTQEPEGRGGLSAGAKDDPELEYEMQEENVDTENEIDLILMKGLVPVFISCKNGRAVSKNELYKLKAVAERFGGPYSRMIIITTVYGCDKGRELSESERAFIQRAEDMGVNMLTGFHLPELTTEEFYKFIRELNI